MPYSCPILMKLDFFSRNIFEKYSNIKFHENPSSGSRVFPFGRTHGLMDRRSERHMTKLTVAFSNASENHLASQCCRILLQKPTATQFREIFFSYGVQGQMAVFTTLLTGSYPQPKDLSELAIVCYRSWHATVKGDK